MTDGWLPDLDRAQGAKYQAIADALDSAIARGLLRDGDRLPAQRDVAAKLGVDLTTVTKAYDAARQRGLIEARGRAGSFVRAVTSLPALGPAPADSGMNMPPDIPDGLLSAALSSTMASLLRHGATARLHYQPAGGAPHDRAVAAALLSGRGIPTVEEQCVVTAGGQNALHGILSAALVPGDAVACGQFVYPGFKGVAERLGLRLIPLPEMSTDALEAACREEAVRAVYIVPTNDNPTTATLTLQQRRDIAGVAQARGLQIIEDDAYGALAARPLPSIASLAPDHCWHVASTSKIISPALRVAHVRAPSVSGALRLAVDAHETAVMAPPLNAAMVSCWIEDGTFDRLLAAMRAECAKRQQLAGTMLGDLDIAGHPQGYHLWLNLPATLKAPLLVDLMRGSGVSVIAAERFAVGRSAREAVRISLGGSIPLERLTRGLRLLHGYALAPEMRASALL